MVIFMEKNAFYSAIDWEHLVAKYKEFLLDEEK